MQTWRETVHITLGEWRWVIIVAVALTALAFLPFIVILVNSSAATDWQFMGILTNYRDGATYLSKMVQGEEGYWLIQFRHTPEIHGGVMLQILYPALGHLARIARISPILLFHTARVVATLIMYMAIYHLGATVWTRVRTRRLFFIVAALGSGFGWFFAPLLSNMGNMPDLTIPEMFPFYSSLVTVHFPLTFACLALLIGLLIEALRPGASHEPTVENGGLMISGLSFALSMLYPQALVPLSAGLVGFVGWQWVQARRITFRELRWVMVVILPILPSAVYYWAITTYNPAIREWTSQNITPAPPLLLLILGLGLPLLIALPGLYRALRRFEADGDRLLVLWLLAVVLLMYFPGSVQRRFSAGMMLPLAYFATRSLEDFWFPLWGERRRYLVLTAVLVVMPLSYLILFFVNTSVAVGAFLPKDYGVALHWLDEHVAQDDVVLAQEDVSLWIPGWAAGARAVYGHPYETLNAPHREQAVKDWYASSTDCAALLETEHVRYVLWGPEEQKLGDGVCVQTLRLVFEAGKVLVYAAQS